MGWPEVEEVDVPEPGYAETISTESSPSVEGTEYYTAPEPPSSAFETMETASQYTDDDSELLERLARLNTPTDSPTANYGGLEPDKEGIETRAAMLKRRREECKAEEVDVALAPTMKIPVNYVFYPDQYRRFREMFPKVTPDSGLAFTHHDHPVAHTATLVGTRRMQGMLRPGEFVLDVNGNPTANEAFNRFQSTRVRKRPGLPRPPIVETMVDMNTSADAVRSITKWGPQRTREGGERWRQGSIRDVTPGMYNTFLFVHTLYYYSMYEINELLAKNQNSKILALVNYSPDQSGTLYGELQYSKSDGRTRQTSPNGEVYSHCDIDTWFQSTSFRGATQQLDCGISWTSQCIGGPMYIITITACPWHLARRHVYEPPHAPTLQVARSNTFLAVVGLGNGTNVQLRITNHGLASELRHFMTLRDRSDPQTFKDLTVKARRITAPDLVLGTRQFMVNDGELSDHVIYAYLVDAPGELQVLDGVKLLRGTLLKPHSEALVFEGRDKVNGFFSSTWLYKTVLSNSTMTPALGARTKQQKALFETLKPPNTGGLLPPKRT